MSLKKFYLLIIIVFTASLIYPQQKMTVKSENFKSYLTNQNFNNSENHRGYFSYPNTDLVSTSFANIRILPTGSNQTSPSATILNTTPVKIFVGANTDNGVGYYYSLNAGLSWAGGDVLPGSVLLSTNPSCAYGNSNLIHYNYADDFIVSDRSNNFGSAWIGRTIVTNTSQFDMNNNTSDVNPSSAYYGRVYVAWSNFTLSQPAIFFSYSGDGGTTYNSAIQIGQPAASHYEQGCNLQVGPNGEIYCAWSTPNLTTNLEDHIAFTKSVNGGVTWSTASNILTINGIRGTILPTNIRSHTFPSMAVDRSGGSQNGYIYVCWTQKNLAPAGNDADICFAYSANGGSTWSSPIRVNDDPINNGKLQFLPRISVDQINGKISILFYDNRDLITPDSCFTYLAVSNDGGGTFFNMRISDISQRPVPLSGYAEGYYTDYNSVVSLNDAVYSFWTDNRNGPAQIYSTIVILKPYITHTPLKDNENTSANYNVQAAIKTFGIGLASGETKVFWGRNTISDSITMTNTSGNNWSASIPGNGTPATYKYYIITKDISGRISSLPDNAPASTFSFKTGADTELPKFFYTPFPSVQKPLWPDTVTVKVTDNVGVDSVWVTWYKNNPGNGYNRFNLTSIGNDYYRGIFNSSQALVDPLDSIYYRICARDISSNHNVDSTALGNFKIAQYYLVRIGSGTSVTPYPYRTFYTDSRTDILYTASELIAYGGAISRIMSIGFNVTSASPQVMSNFNFKIKNTTLSTLTGFTSSSWTNVNLYNYTVAGTGWQYVIFQTPFIWDGTSNLLIEICFDDNSFNSNSSVYASQSTGMVWHQAQDLPAGNGCNDLTGGSAQTLRPNITFVMNSILDVKENEKIIPNEFLLRQNYPNPFNPVTKISFSVPKKDFVTLKIYDILGKEITTLVNEIKTPGNYIIDFNGQYLSSGVYFYKMNSGDFSDVKRMLLIK